MRQLQPRGIDSPSLTIRISVPIRRPRESLRRTLLDPGWRNLLAELDKAWPTKAQTSNTRTKGAQRSGAHNT